MATFRGYLNYQIFFLLNPFDAFRQPSHGARGEFSEPGPATAKSLGGTEGAAMVTRESGHDLPINELSMIWKTHHFPVWKMM